MQEVWRSEGCHWWHLRHRFVSDRVPQALVLTCINLVVPQVIILSEASYHQPSVCKSTIFHQRVSLFLFSKYNDFYFEIPGKEQIKLLLMFYALTLAAVALTVKILLVSKYSFLQKCFILCSRLKPSPIRQGRGEGGRKNATIQLFSRFPRSIFSLLDIFKCKMIVTDMNEELSILQKFWHIDQDERKLAYEVGIGEKIKL